VNDAAAPGSERGLSEVPRAFSLTWGGKNHPVQELARPFLDELEGELTGAAGFQLLRQSFDDFHIPDEIFGLRKRDKGPTAVIDGITLVVGLSVFLGTSIGGWAVSRVCDDVFDAKVRPALARLFQKQQQDKILRRRELIVRFGAWYDTDGIFVEVIAAIGPEDDRDRVEELLPEAHRRALVWIEQHGITKPVLTYRVRHGDLSKFPHLGDAIPPS
jgi:hypothetical protein